MPLESAHGKTKGIGDLPRDFWTVVDGRCNVCTVTTIFLSSSRERSQPIAHMLSAEDNVLWELHQSVANETGIHCAADVSLLSQFPGEGECLLPPGTMLVVASESAQADGEDNKADVAEACVEDGKSFRLVRAAPSYL